MTTVPFGHNSAMRQNINPTHEMLPDELEKNLRGFLTHALDLNQQIKDTATLLDQFGTHVQAAPDDEVLNAALGRWKYALIRNVFQDFDIEPTPENISGPFIGSGIRAVITSIDHDLKTPESMVEVVLNRSNFETLKRSVDQLWFRLDEANEDLFQNQDVLPASVKELVEFYTRKIEEDEGNSYHHCAMFQDDMNLMGYTFDYGLDGVPFNLREGVKASGLDLDHDEPEPEPEPAPGM